MFITCESIMKFPYLEKIKLIAGEGGINRIIKWVLILEEPKYSEWLKGGELVLTTGLVIKNDEDALCKLVEDLNSKKLSGLVISVGPNIPKTPKKVIELANSLDFPIFELPFDVKFIDVTQSICRAIFNNKVEQETIDSFMKDIIFGDIIFSEEIYNRAAFYGYNSQKKYYSIVVQISNCFSFFYNNKMNYQENIMQSKQHVEQIIIETLDKRKLKSIKTIQSDSIIVMVPLDENHAENTSEIIAETIVKNVKNKLPDLVVNIGIGRACDELKKFKNSVFQAIKALKVLSVSGENNNISNYRNIGLYRLLFQTDNYDEMEDIYYGTLESLIEYDKKNGTNLMVTLEAYIEAGGKLEKHLKAYIFIEILLNIGFQE